MVSKYATIMNQYMGMILPDRRRVFADMVLFCQVIKS